MKLRTPILLTSVALIGLTACGQPNYGGGYGGSNNGNTRTGATVGALIGGAIGASQSGDNKLARAATGAVIGGAIGGVIGNQLDKQARELQNEIGGNGTTVVNTGQELVVTMPQDILFGTDSTALRPDLQNDLGAMAANINRYPDTRVEIVGHTDNTGAADYNANLSQRRADAVASVLTRSGVSPSRISAYGRGEDQPIASNLSAEGRAQNRRVEIIIRPTNL